MSSNNISMKRSTFRVAVGLLGLIAAVTMVPSAWADIATVTKTFNPASITAGTTSTLTVDIANSPPGNPNSIAFTDNYPAGLRNAAAPTENGNCGSPTLTGAIGGSSLAMSGGSISGNKICTITISVTACPVGSHTNPSFLVSSSTNSVNSNAPALTVTAGTPSAATSTVTASPTSVPADGTTTSTVTVTLKDSCGNPVSGKTVALSAGSGSSTISAASGPSNASGVVTFTVKDLVVEAVTYTATDTTDSVTLTQKATVTFTTLIAPTVTKSFSLTPIAANGTSTLTVRITNPNAGTITGLAFTDNYPANLKNAATPALSNTCGGVATGAANGTLLRLTGGSLAGGSNCTLSVSVTSSLAGSYANSSGAVTSTNAANGTSASATLTVKAISAANSTVVASPTSVPADASTTSTITVTLKDGAGNPVSGKTVTLTAGAGSSIITTVSGTTGAGGVATFKVKDGTAEGPITYTATDTTDAIVVTQTAQVTFTALPTVVSINCAVSCAATNAATVSWTVTFSKSVTGVDASAFTLAASGLSGAYISSVTGSGTTWTVTAGTGIGAGTLGLNQTGPGTVSPSLSGTFTGQVFIISGTPALAEYRMDDALWNGTAGEVMDSSGNGNHAQAFNSGNTLGTTPAIAGNPGTCSYGVFDNGGTITQGYVQTPLPNLTTDFTVTAWIRTTNNTIAGQRILVDDQNNSGGYGISLGDPGAGRIRFYSRGITPVILDSTYAIANNTWYFVAAVADITNKKRTIYVFDTAGTLLNSTTEAAWTGGAWGTDAGPVSIGAETNASGEAPASFHFRGNLDEVRVYQQALNQAAVTAIATQTHACAIAVAVPNHYELSLPTNSIACLPSTVTVTACTDATSPCANPFAAVSGTTAILATSAGTLGVTPVTFDATGVASTTLSYPAAPNGTLVTVTLSGEQTAASNPRQWCPDGAGCVVADSGTTTFNTAGFIFSAAAGGGVATIPTQAAGISSAAYYLRAVKTSTATQACEAALVGPGAVEFAYECNNPATCYTSDLMSVNGGAATTIARNDNGSVASYLPVNMTFDANGNAPFTFNYSDVGQVKLWVRKSAGGSLLSGLTGSTNSFVVKPHHFDITGIACTTVGAGTCAPANGTGNNPAASGPAGAAFIQAGQPFKATVTAMNGAATPAFTPNFGKETVAEGAELTSFNHLPGLGGASAINRGLSGFNAGAVTPTDLSWNEVGVLQLHVTLSNANGYLGSDLVNGKNSVVSAVDPYVGRFIPDHFDTVVTPQGGGFAYSGNPVGPVPGQPFTVTVTANASASPTANYNNAGGYAKNVDLSVPVGGAAGQLYVDAVAGGTGAVPAVKFVNGVANVDRLDATGKISFVFNSLPYAEQAIQIHAEDADSVTSSGANGSINIRHGRLRLFNAFGSELANLSLPLQADYWTGNSWVLNGADSFTVIPAASVALSGYSGTLSAANLGAGHVTGTTLAGGLGVIVLTKPVPVATGSVDLAINLGAGAADLSCLGVHPATTGAAIPWLRSVNGNCAVTYDRDPSASGSFGIYAPETRKTIHMRELY